MLFGQLVLGRISVVEKVIVMNWKMKILMFKIYDSAFSQVDSVFYLPWDGKMITSHISRAVMLCGWGVKAGMV